MFSLQFLLDTVADAQYVLVKWPEFSGEQIFQIFQAYESLVEGRQLCLWEVHWEERSDYAERMAKG